MVFAPGSSYHQTVNRLHEFRFASRFVKNIFLYNVAKPNMQYIIFNANILWAFGLEIYDL